LPIESNRINRLSRAAGAVKYSASVAYPVESSDALKRELESLRQSLEVHQPGGASAS
jgi:hypothetical protein